MKKSKKLTKWQILFIVIGALVLISALQSMFDDKATNNEPDYITLCANGDFVQANAIKGKVYERYRNKYAQWRGGEWVDREAIALQNRYHTVASHVFGQELQSIFGTDDSLKDAKALNLLISIPADGMPLAEGVYDNGMFYNNGAAIGNHQSIDHVIYQAWVRFYNDRCDQLLDLAIVNSNTTLAEKVYRLYKTEIITTFAQDTVKGDNYCIATVKYDNTRSQRAIERTTSL